MIWELSHAIGQHQTTFLWLAHLASAPYDRFVWQAASRALEVATYLLRRGTSEIAPPAGQIVLSGSEPVGMLAAMAGADLAVRRLRAAHALARELLAPDDDARRRARLAARALCAVAPTDYYLARISVAQRARRTGLGTWLMERLFERAETAGATRCHLEVDPDNEPAIRLYERFGFATEGVRCVEDPATGATLRYAHMIAPLG